MNQNIWGPHLWFSLHTISFHYPLKPKEEDKRNYASFFTELQHVIPCSICKKNYKRHLLEFPIHSHLEDRKALVYWVIDLHNMVNSETGKRVISYEDALKRYEDTYQKKIILDAEAEDQDKKCIGMNCEESYHISNQLLFNLLIIILLLGALYVFHRKYKVKISLR
jgi:hypothetical protein